MRYEKIKLNRMSHSDLDSIIKNEFNDELDGSKEDKIAFILLNQEDSKDNEDIEVNEVPTPSEPTTQETSSDSGISNIGGVKLDRINFEREMAKRRGEKYFFDKTDTDYVVAQRRLKYGRR